MKKWSDTQVMYQKFIVYAECAENYWRRYRMKKSIVQKKEKKLNDLQQKEENHAQAPCATM